MLRVFTPHGNRLLAEGEALPADAVWIDLLDPTPAEEALLESALGIDVPTAADMAEIESSSRLYLDNGAIVLTVSLVVGILTDQPESCDVSFVLGRNLLVTIRYRSVRSFDQFVAQAGRAPEVCSDPGAVLLSLFDIVIDRLADGFEHVGHQVEVISHAAFRRAATEQTTRQMRRTNQALQLLLSRLGAAQNALSKARQSTVSLSRALLFLQSATGKHAALSAQVKMQLRDLGSLSEQGTTIGGNLNFLLDATLGLISIEQNAVFKTLSVASLVFLPPTLVAGIYGMNFEHMPELGWQLGYPMALLAMLLAAVLPYAVFRWRGWI